MFEDFAWISVLLHRFFYATSSPLTSFIVRMSWAFYIIEYQALMLFVEKLIDQNAKITLKQKILIICSSILSIIFVIFSVICLCYPPDTLSIQLRTEELAALYAIFLLMLPTLILHTRKLKTSNAPRIIKKQIKILTQFLIVPRIIFDFIQYFPFTFIQGHFSNAYAVNGISTVILTIALLFCARRIIGLRFLNFNSHVQSPRRFNFIDGFKEVLEQLSRVTTLKELSHLTQTLFKEAFSIPLSRTMLYIRSNGTSDHGPKYELSRIEMATEMYLSQAKPTIHNYLHDTKILIHDEIAFSHFYESQDTTASVVHFLDTINADIFLPIYKNNRLIAYIIVERAARSSEEFYSNIERDEMLVFASYLANIINLLQNRSLETLLVQEKELKEELYHKHQEIMQYKESLRSFLKQGKKDIGIIFYKQRRFTFANQAAQEIVKININVQEGHPMTKALKRIAHLVEEYKAPQKMIVTDLDGNKITIAGVPNLEGTAVILSVSYPDITDLITSHLDQLKDPTKWDYVLYLETTKPGQLINQLIPGSSEVFLNLKITLLQLALSKKALLLEMTPDDALPMAELIHHISLRETLHVITLTSRVTGSELAIKFFGASPIFGLEIPDKPLFEKLHDSGTLYIQNIDLLDIETQEYIAEYIKYGSYRAYKSDLRVSSSVRIICSTTQHLPSLVQAGLFSEQLYLELTKATVSMPMFATLPEHELADLAQGYTTQALKHDNFAHVMELSDKDKRRLAQQRPSSLYELKHRVQRLLEEKSKRNKIDQETHFDPAYQTADPDLVQAARLGRHALRDQRIMNMLWNKFKNQNKIATFLGVNRSSVNRRCKEYHLEEEI